MVRPGLPQIFSPSPFILLCFPSNKPIRQKILDVSAPLLTRPDSHILDDDGDEKSEVACVVISSADPTTACVSGYESHYHLSGLPLGRLEADRAALWQTEITENGRQLV